MSSLSAATTSPNNHHAPQHQPQQHQRALHSHSNSHNNSHNNEHRRQSQSMPHNNNSRPTKQVFPTGPGVVTTQCTVPHTSVGFLIGRGGTTILGMHQRSSCFISIEKPDEQSRSSGQRVVTLTGTEPNIQLAQLLLRQQLELMMQEKLSYQRARRPQHQQAKSRTFRNDFAWWATGGLF